MTEVRFELDNQTDENVRKLMSQFGCRSKIELFRKAIAWLEVVDYVNSNNGEIIARRGNCDTRLVI